MLGSRGQSVDEPRNSQEIVGDCMKAYASLNKVTAYYRQLVMCVGGTSDSTRLREDLEDSRKRAHDLSTGEAVMIIYRIQRLVDSLLQLTCYCGLQKKLMSLLTDQQVSQKERVQLERMFVLFLSTLELYQQDLYKAQHLNQLFPLQTRHKRLISTGVIGKSSEVSWRPRSVKSPSGRPSDMMDHQCSSDLSKQIEQVERMLNDMEMKVSVPVWTVEATEEAWAEIKSTHELEEGSTNEILATEETLSRGCCAHGQPWHRPPCMIS